MTLNRKLIEHNLPLAEISEASAKEKNVHIGLPPQFHIWWARRPLASSRATAYDDLIENNYRRIAILEEMARLLYREWFVHFCFPGHEDVEMVDSELGPIPEGWETVESREVSKVNRSNLKKSKAPEVINYVTIGSVNESQIEEVESIPHEEAPSRARRIVQHGDIIWTTARPNLKSYVLVLDPLSNMIVSTDCREFL